MGKPPYINRNQQRATKGRISGSGTNSFNTFLKYLPRTEDGFFSNASKEIQKFLGKFGLTPLQFFGALIGGAIACHDVYEKFIEPVLGDFGNLGGTTSPSINNGIFSTIVDSMNGSPQGQFLVYLIFTACVSWFCILILLILTRKQGEVKNIFAYILTALSALFISAWTENFYTIIKNERQPISDFYSCLLTLVAAAIFVFIAKTQFKLTQKEITQIQLTRVNLILTFLGASVLSVMLKIGDLNG